MITLAAGRLVGRLDVLLYRDSPFAEEVTRPDMTAASFFFPTLVPAVEWQATVVAGVASFAIGPEVANLIDPDATNRLPVELWVDGECVSAGFVRRRGGPITLPSPGDGGTSVYPDPDNPGYYLGLTPDTDHPGYYLIGA